jgi:uncharacterized protein YuzE
MRLSHDPDADALYIYLREAPVAFTESLDHRRNIDYDADQKPIGIEVLNVSKGVNVADLPEHDAVVRVLREHGIPLVPEPALP